MALESPVTNSAGQVAWTRGSLHDVVTARIAARNHLSRELFSREAPRVAEVACDMAARFARGGRLLAFGNGPYATDAQHVAVEFVHPVIVGKRALPAIDVSYLPAASVSALLRADDMVMGFGPPQGDAAVHSMLAHAQARGARTLALTGRDADYALAAFDDDPFVHQELVEVLYHTLWESVHVFLEHRETGDEVGASAFLYPFLGQSPPDTRTLVEDVARSIVAKAGQDEHLRTGLTARAGTILVEAAFAIRARLARGGTLLTFGNGGSATDANDFAIDCAVPAGPGPSMPAISLARDAAVLSALANDIGREAMFHRQLRAYGGPCDVAVALSTSGGSDNVVAALVEAKKMGMATVALLGRDGGQIVRQNLADFPLVVESNDIPRIQEVQASVYHVLIDVLRLLIEPADAGSTKQDPAYSDSFAKRDPAYSDPAGSDSRAGSDPASMGDTHVARVLWTRQNEGLELFGARACPYTAELREQLDWEKRPYVEHDVETDAAALTRLVQLTGGRLVPVLVDRGRVVSVGWRGRSCTV